MLLYVLICVSLALTGIAGLQFIYMFYLERIDAERRKRIVRLEHECKDLAVRLSDAEHCISEQRQLLETAYIDVHEEEVWADVIDER